MLRWPLAHSQPICSVPIRVTTKENDQIPNQFGAVAKWYLINSAVLSSLSHRRSTTVIRAPRTAAYNHCERRVTCRVVQRRDVTERDVNGERSADPGPEFRLPGGNSVRGPFVAGVEPKDSM